MFLNSFRSRLFAVSVTLLVVFVTGVGLYLHQVLRQWTEEVIEEDLQVRGRLVADAMEFAPDEMDYADIVDTLDGIKEQRITVVGADGALLADTHLTPDEIEEAKNFGQRPEIVDARNGDHSLTRRYSRSIDQEMLNVALPSANGDAVVRVSVPLREVEEILSGLRALLLIGALFGIGGSILISGIASKLMSHILQDVLDRARADEALEATPVPVPPLTSHTQDTSLRQVTRALEDTLEQLAEQRNRFRAVLDGMSEGVIATDDELSITLSNRTVRHLLGLQGDPEGQSLYDWLPDDIVDMLVERTDEIVEFEVTSPSKRLIQAHATHRYDSTGYIFVFHDVTAIRQLESVRRDFVANVSHELRTPVTIIQANAETLLDGALESPEHAQSFTEGIHRNSRRLARLIGDLLDLSRIEDGEMEFDLRPVNLAQLTNWVIDDVEGYADSEHIRIHSDIEGDWKVRADRDGLGQVLTNLLENAVKYGGDDVTVEVCARRHNDKVLVAVHDDGPGVAPEHRERIFERFYRIQGNRSSKKGGTGLGLSIVKHIVHAMDGEVGCRERDGGGSVFWFTLPEA